jgi:hypothetical protein
MSAGLVLCAACATQSVPKERLDSVAIITSGSTNLFLATKFGPVISVAEVDGVPPEKRFGPIELAPGPHKIKMKCDRNETEREWTVSAGEVYEFSIVMLGGACEGDLVKVRSGQAR